MDTAVSLVQAYLHVNGYFTVTEYPVLEAMREGGYRTATDLDVLAFRFPGAARLVPAGAGDAGSDVEIADADPLLDAGGRHGDMLIGEVKEGKAELNEGARDPAVLRAALVRFGCCDAAEGPSVTEGLLRRGRVTTPGGHLVRLVAFGSTGNTGRRDYLVVTLGHVVRFLREHLRRHWDVLRHGQYKHPGFAFMVMLEKALHGDS